MEVFGLRDEEMLDVLEVLKIVGVGFEGGGILVVLVLDLWMRDDVWDFGLSDDDDG